MAAGDELFAMIAAHRRRTADLVESLSEADAATLASAGIVAVALILGALALGAAEQFGPRDLLEFSVLAEGLGYDSVWVSDHFQPWRHTGGHAPFSLSWLAALGERSSLTSLSQSQPW